MKISKEQVKNIAYLARLELDDERVELFSKQLSQILEYMEKLSEVDTSNIDPLYSPVEHTTPYREDEVFCEYKREEVLQNAPEEDGEHYIVPKVVS
jgi:aspartyl-tRNA(Asn)/glutamyl-tRNA(Gln) amidotransferase subunit C